MASLSTPRRLRCAIYTRKSTEEGLDQAFNSLDAQREACAAYILSQVHEGWSLLPDFYDDGGFTGGNMDRPGLKQLLADVKCGKIDVVVVYKVDRLTRSLADFAKIVDVLDDAKASFVSVTQAFNTTSSMGRLTRNVLLSFAQFEREVISERVRDKVAASKAKGMWMGGPVPLGYRVEDRKLVVVLEEAETVRDIMRRYLHSQNIYDLLHELEHAGIVSKRTTGRDGTVRGGVPVRRGALFHLLSNRTYLGLTTHKGKAYEGQHEAIVEANLFEAVQARLAERSNPVTSAGARRRVSLLAGMIRDQHGRPMSPCHTRRHGRRYSYYASHPGDGSRLPALRLPGGELDLAVRHGLAKLLADTVLLHAMHPRLAPQQLFALLDHCAEMSGLIATMPVAGARSLLESMNFKVVVSSEAAEASICSQALLHHAEIEGHAETRLSLDLPTNTVRFGHEQRLRLDPPQQTITPRDARLVDLIARAFASRDELMTLSQQDVDAMPVTRLRHLERTARLAYLAPDIVRAVIDGRQPKTLTARALARLGSLPLGWDEQRAMLRFEPA